MDLKKLTIEELDTIFANVFENDLRNEVAEEIESRMMPKTREVPEKDDLEKAFQNLKNL